MNRSLSRYVHVVVLAICVAFCVASLYSCVAIMAVVNTISPKLLMILLAFVAGLLAAALGGIPLLAGGLIGAAGGTVAVLSEPAPPPQTVTNITGPGAHVMVRGALQQETLGMPTWFWIVVGAVIAILIRGRHWLPFLFSKDSKGYRWAVILHMLWGGKPPVIPPQFLDLPKE